ncbi:MAG: hypothetical protein ABIJ96_09335 [Elusimicrobiota bacterium]
MKIKKVEEELIGTKLFQNGQRPRTVGYLRGSKVEYKMLLDADGRVAKLCRVRGMPLYYFVGPDGDVRWSKGDFPPISIS